MMQKIHSQAILSVLLASMLALLALLPCMLKAQSSFGAVVGSVTDSSGAVIPGATVTLTNIGTNDQRTAQSDGTGDYRFVDIEPAVYKIEVEKAGFKRFLLDRVEVRVDVTARVNANLPVGVVTETVEVADEPALLQTESGSLGAVIEGKQVEEMPLNGRNVMNLIALAPGVVPMPGSQGATTNNSTGSGGGGNNNNNSGNTSPQNWGNYSIGGGIGGQSAQYVDGAPLNVLGGTGAGSSMGFVPTQDSIHEFRVITSDVSAEFGRFAGGVVNMATKSGTNAFHGSVYEYFRNTVLNANSYFNNGAGVQRPKFNQNQYGATVGGPIRKDKVFFFAGWEGFGSRIGNVTATNVPTPAMENGVFTHQVVDPTGKCPIVQDAAAGTWTIPKSCWDSTAAILKGYYPSTPNNPSNPVDNWISDPVIGNNNNQYMGRVDYNLSEKQRIFTRFTYWGSRDLSQNIFEGHNSFDTGNAFAVNHTYQAVVGDTYTFSPTTLLDVRASGMRVSAGYMPGETNVNESQFGPGWAALAPQLTTPLLPEFNLGGGDNLQNFSAIDQYNLSVTANYAISASLNKIAGNHDLKFGGEFLRMDNNVFSGGFPGLFIFTPQYTHDEFAAFLLGFPNVALVGTNIGTTAIAYPEGYYATDTWRKTPKLTLTLGLRWELPDAIKEKHNDLTVLLPDTVDPYTGVKGTLALADSALYHNKTSSQVKHDLFAPRLGFAYQLSHDTVLRGGYGISYLPLALLAGLLPTNSPVVGANTQFTNGNPPTDFLSNPFPKSLYPNGINQPVGHSNPAFMQSYASYVGNPLSQQSLQRVEGGIVQSAYPYAQEWDLSMSQQFTTNTVMEIAYSGAKGSHLPEVGAGNGISIDELSSQYYSMGSALESTVTGVGGSSIYLGQSLRPYPAYSDLDNTNANLGATTYNALEAMLQRRFHAGGTLMASYTWSKAIGNTDNLLSQKGFIQDFNNLHNERSVLGFNTPNRAVISYVLDLPFGKGQRFGRGVTGIAGSLVSGWAVNGITTFQSGFPLAISDSSSGNQLTKNFGLGTLRPNVVAGCNKRISGSAVSRMSEWFNTSCFQYPGDYAIGDEPRVDSTLSDQGIDNFDISLVKTTQIAERFQLQFRAETFNTFNRVQFADPGTAQDDPTAFGVVAQQQNNPRLIQFSLRLNF